MNIIVVCSVCHRAKIASTIWKMIPIPKEYIISNGLCPKCTDEQKRKPKSFWVDPDGVIHRK